MRASRPVGCAEDWTSRWATLSHGERKRAQIGVALWCGPDVLALDEPSNHIDAAARHLLLGELHAYRGIGLLVSHDRQMLDGLCRQCLFLEDGVATLRRGGYTKGRAQGKAEQARLRDLHAQAKARLRRLEQELVRRRQKVAAEHRLRSKRGLAPRDFDAREKINRGRLTDSTSGASYRQLQGRASQAADRLAGIRVRKETTMGIWLPDARSRRDWLFRIPAGCIPIGDGARRLELPELAMKPDDRVALVGPNGSGKTTLLRHILPRLNLPPDRVLYMPQEISAEQARDILRQVRTLAPPGLGRLMNVVSRLGSQPDRLLQTEQPSPGEVRKLLLALGVAQAAHLVVMDEPTNHLDLPSIECLEEALRDCPGGLLLVSHDLVFLNRLARTRWDILTSADAGGGSELRIASIPDRSRG